MLEPDFGTAMVIVLTLVVLIFISGVKMNFFIKIGILGLIGVNLFSNMLTFMSFGLLYPFVICYKQKWFAKHTIINRKRLIFKGNDLKSVTESFIEEMSNVNSTLSSVTGFDMKA